MRVLVACERSGVVREAFRRRGHVTWSCDVEPADDGSQFHFIADAQTVIARYPWDLLIAFPPCTHLANSGARWFPYKREEQRKAVWFFRALANCAIPRIAIENPVGIMSTVYRKPDQILQPWQFGHPEAKRTCLWLKGLPKLEPTNVLPKPECGYWQNQTPSRQNKLGESKSRAKRRSQTYTGVAEAMAAQWG